MDEFERAYIGREYASGVALAERYGEMVHQAEQVRMFKEVAKESDWCILGFADGLGS